MNSSTDNNTISLFLRHPEPFVGMLSRYYPFTPSQIRKYENTLDFVALSGNEYCSWDDVTVDRYKDRMDWYNFSSRSPFLADHRMLEKYKKHIVWGLETSGKDNTGYDAYMPHESIFFNPHITWNIDLIKRHLGILQMGRLSLSGKFSDAGDLLTEYPELWHWNELSMNTSLPWSAAFIKQHAERLEWKNLSMNHAIPWDFNLFETFRGDVDLNEMEFDEKVYDRLTANTDIVEKYPDMLNWELVSANELLPWVEENLLERWKEHINWKGLSRNKVVFKNDPEFFHKNLEHWTAEIFYEGLSRNASLPWSVELLDQYSKLWNWFDLAYNSGLPWGIELIERYFHKWYIDPATIDQEFYYAQSGLIIGSSAPWQIAWFLHFEDFIDFEFLCIQPNNWKLFEPYVNDEVVDLVMRVV